MGRSCIPFISYDIVFNSQIGSDFSSSSYIERTALCVYDFHKIYANSFEDDQKLTVLDFPAPKNPGT